MKIRTEFPFVAWHLTPSSARLNWYRLFLADQSGLPIRAFWWRLGIFIGRYCGPCIYSALQKIRLIKQCELIIGFPFLVAVGNNAKW